MESMSFELPSRRRAGARWLLRARDGARQPLRKLPLRALRGRGLAVVLPPSGVPRPYARAICFDGQRYSLCRPPGEPLVLCPEQSVRVQPATGAWHLRAYLCTCDRKLADLIDFYRCDVETPKLALPPALSLLPLLLQPPLTRCDPR